jgi:hypothetical protein
MPLDNHVGGRERHSRVEQPPEDRRGAAEGQIRHDLERLARQRDVTCVSAEHLDVRKPLLERSGEGGIELHRDDASGATCERSRQRAGAGAEIEHQVVTLNLRSANELRRELATAEEVPPATARWRPDGHGRPPCP